jgi:hypothetical protein
MNQETQSGQQPDKGIAHQGESDFTELTSGSSTAPAKIAPTQESTTQIQPQTGTTPTGAEQQTQTPTPPAAPSTTIDPKMLESIVSAAVRGSQPQTQAVAQPEKQLTDEEFNKKFGVVSVTPEHIAQLLDQDPKKAAVALNNLLQGVARQAVLMNQELTAAEVSRMRGEIDPHIKSWQTYQREVREQQVEAKFFKTYPDLANERDLVMTIKDSLIAKVQAGQLTFASEDEALKAVATATAATLARLNKTAATAGTTQNTQTTGQNTGRQMSAASTAGRSGTGQATAKSDVEQIFGNDAV